MAHKLTLIYLQGFNTTSTDWLPKCELLEFNIVLGRHSYPTLDLVGIFTVQVSFPSHYVPIMYTEILILVIEIMFLVCFCFCLQRKS